MKAATFDYHAPRTRRDLVSLLGSLENAKILAGGQSLVPMLNMRYALPDHVIDINYVADLAYIQETQDAIEIGAMTRQCTLLASPLVRSKLPILSNVLRHVGHLQTRSRGTIGGSLCHLDPAAELPLVAALYDVTLDVFSPRRTRRIDFKDWCRGFMTSALAVDEVLGGMRLKPWPSDHGWAFHEFARRHGDFAIVACGVLLERKDELISRAVVALTGVDMAPIRLTALEAELVGLSRDAATAHAVCRAQSLRPMSDAYYSDAFRLRLAETLVGRAVHEAFDRAGGGLP